MLFFVSDGLLTTFRRIYSAKICRLVSFDLSVTKSFISVRDICIEHIVSHSGDIN